MKKNMVDTATTGDESKLCVIKRMTTGRTGTIINLLESSRWNGETI